MTGRHVFCTADDLQFLARSGIHKTNVQLIRIGMLFLALDKADHDLGDSVIAVLDRVDLDPGTGDFLSQFQHIDLIQ
ncbi:hypothetical protein D1872_290450 [compost metagenome]